MNNPDFLILPYEILSDDRLTLRQIRVLMAIFSWRKKNTNLARVSRNLLSERTGYRESSISNITTDLVKLGWIEKVGNGGKSQWSEYRVKDIEGINAGSKKNKSDGDFQDGTNHSNGTQNVYGTKNINGTRIMHETVHESCTQTVHESCRGIDTVKNNSSKNSSKKSKPKKFTPPSVDDVLNYFAEINYEDYDQAEKFVDHYQANGWLVGGKTKMKCWKASVRNWKRRAEEYKAQNQAQKKSGDWREACQL